MTDTTGLRGGLEVHSAEPRDRDGRPDVLVAVVARYAVLRSVFAPLWADCSAIACRAKDGGYGGLKTLRRAECQDHQPVGVTFLIPVSAAA